MECFNLYWVKISSSELQMSEFQKFQMTEVNNFRSPSFQEFSISKRQNFISFEFHKFWISEVMNITSYKFQNFNNLKCITPRDAERKNPHTELFGWKLVDEKRLNKAFCKTVYNFLKHFLKLEMINNNKKRSYHPH